MRIALALLLKSPIHCGLLTLCPGQKARTSDDLEDKLCSVPGSQTLVVLFMLPLGAIGAI